MKVLLAEDDVVSRKFMQRMLEKAGLEVVCVENGVDAVACLLAPDGPRLAVLDWEMPLKDGLSVCREVRACASDAYVYLILLTSRDSTDDVVCGLEAGADDYLTKPCVPQEMRARVRAGQRVLHLQDKLLHDARHDPLTNLPNRTLFRERLAESVRSAREESRYQFALLFIDIDRFKLINDSFGHVSGDKLMSGVAERLLRAVRAEDTILRLRSAEWRTRLLNDVVARLGGDEFVILLDGVTSTEDAVRVAQRVQATLQLPFMIGDEEVVVTASIGIAMSDNVSVDATEILQRADAAMYRAKMLGKSRYEVSNSVGHTPGANVFKLERDLRRGIENNEFVVFYQPILSLPSTRVRGFEALVRWRHPELGLIPPSGFIPAAEDTGLIVPLGAWILREACRQMQEWNTRFPDSDPLIVSVNVSPRQFHQQDLVQLVSDALSESGLPPAALDLEVTENLTMEDAARSTRLLMDLSALGLSLSLDDFGTGYSSLSHLNKLPVQTLKIDRSFVSELGSRRESLGIVQTIISLGHSLGMQVVAEGVENEAQLSLLQKLKCDLIQGYLFSCPVDAATATAMLSTGSREGCLSLRGVTAA